MSFLPSLPNGSLLDVFRANPDVARPLHELAHQVMRGPSPLSEGERELIAAYVSSLNGCDYCRQAHTGVAERFGVAPQLVDELANDIATAGVSDKLKPILQYVRKLNDTPGLVQQADADDVFAAGWDETALNHAILVCAQFNFMNRWVSGLGLELDAGLASMAAKHMHEKGYRGINELLQEKNKRK